MRERESDRQRESVSGARTETETGKETERDTDCDGYGKLYHHFLKCSAVYPSLPPALRRAQATSSLEKRPLTVLLNI